MQVDPAGLLSRIPELEPLAQIPAIGRAIERGDPHRVFRALFWANLLGKIPAQHKAVAKQLIGERALFLKPIRSAPVLATINGVGATVYGHSQARNDGSYITTHYLVVLFIPLFPFSAYLVTDGQGGKGGQRSWNFVGKTPLGPLAYAWQRLLALGAIAAMLLAASSALWHSRNNELYVVSALGEPLTIEVGGQRVTQQPLGRSAPPRIELAAGVHPIRILSSNGSVIEEGRVTVRAGSALNVWNVLGASPMVSGQAIYSTSGTDSPPPEVHCGRSEIHLEAVDYLFVEPPSQLSTQGERLTKTYLHELEGGLPMCVEYVVGQGLERGDLSAALTFLRRVGARASETTLGVVAYLLRQGQVDQALSLSADLRDQNPEQVIFHRAYVASAERALSATEVAAEYAALAAAQPDNIDIVSLAASLLPMEEAVAALERLAAEHPEHAPTHRGLAVRYESLARFDAALPHFEWLRANSPETLNEIADDYVSLLVATGDTGQARAILIGQAPQDLYAAFRLSELSNFSDQEALRQRISELPEQQRLNMAALSAYERRANLEPSGPMSPLAETDALFGRDPQRAVEQALTSPREAWLEPLFSPLYYVVLQTLLTNPAHAAHLDTHLNNFGRGRRNAEALVNYLRNGGAIPFFIPPSAMPGLWWARAQFVSGNERNTLLETARRLCPLTPSLAVRELLCAQRA